MSVLAFCAGPLLGLWLVPILVTPVVKVPRRSWLVPAAFSTGACALAAWLLTGCSGARGSMTQTHSGRYRDSSTRGPQPFAVIGADLPAQVRGGVSGEDPGRLVVAAGGPYPVGQGDGVGLRPETAQVEQRGGVFAGHRVRRGRPASPLPG